eukprot:GILK01013070.1.p1 GENE.GILK01013070.1~~GILK01013070.1.p1  ORF type:complete len:211 (-),score=8.42 GILK01013070.1:210-788(-)
MTDDEMERHRDSLATRAEQDNYEANCVAIDNERVIEVEATVTPKFKPISIGCSASWSSSNCITIKFTDTIVVVVSLRLKKRNVSYSETFFFDDRFQLCDNRGNDCFKVKGRREYVLLNELLDRETRHKIRKACTRFEKVLSTRCPQDGMLDERIENKRRSGETTIGDIEQCRKLQKRHTGDTCVNPAKGQEV